LPEGEDARRPAGALDAARQGGARRAAEHARGHCVECSGSAAVYDRAVNKNSTIVFVTARAALGAPMLINFFKLTTRAVMEIGV
jgi:hypothetical protein